MPNTLAHFGVQTLVTRALIRTAEAEWIVLGCVLPDVPWILQRILQVVVLGPDRYALRLYVIAQASLLVTLLLCACMATFAARPLRAFAVLGLGAFSHLLLDALQTKWGGGVHLIAPWSWELWNLGLFWPESAWNVVLTILGVVAVFGLVRSSNPERPVLLAQLSRRRVALAGAFAAAYLAAPLALRDAVFSSDSHFIRTLDESANRSGRPIEIDRVEYFESPEGDRILTFVEEELWVGTGPVAGAPTLQSLRDSGAVSIVSIQGRFLDSKRVVVDQIQRHAGRLRDVGSYLGLAWLVVLWARLLSAERPWVSRDDRSESPTR